jgi:hypothetical protein
MSRKINCPSCGAVLDVYGRHVLMLICEYCETNVVFDKEAVKAAGKMSVLRDDDSYLFVGAVGEYREKRFEVIGRVRYDFGRGFWDEWYLELSDGSKMWLSDDGEDLSYEQPVTEPADVPPFEKLKINDQISLAGKRYRVEEKGRAVCSGGEGELPFLLQQGESYDYLDCSTPDGKNMATIEYEEEGPKAFVGVWVRQEELRIEED